VKTNINEIEVNGITYIRKGTEKIKAERVEGMPYVIIRTYSAGVFAGYLKTREGREVLLLNARRLWYWSGAASLSQIAVEGVKNPDSCKFPCEVPSVLLTEAVEIIECMEEARLSIKGVRVWKK